MSLSHYSSDDSDTPISENDISDETNINNGPNMEDIDTK